MSENPILALYPAFAVPADYDGPLAREFHEMVARKFLAGMCGGHTSSVDPSRLPELVRYHLSVDWQFRNGLTFPVRNLDGFDLWDWLRSRWVGFKALFLRNPYV